VINRLMKTFLLFAIPFLLMACTTSAAISSPEKSAPSESEASSTPHGEDSEFHPFNEDQNDRAKVDEAIINAAATGKKALIVMGANWCHDSKALATQFEKPRFQTLIQSSYILEYIDVGQKNKNQKIARRFGLDGTPGTPTVMIIDGTGKLLNPKDAPTWRNAASRSEDEIYSYFEDYATTEPNP